MITENLSTLTIHKLSQEQYDREFTAGDIDENAIYLTPDEDIDLSEYAKKSDVPTKVSEFDNDAGYLTQHQDLSGYALKSDIPTDYIKEIPSEYITETELENKGYLTEHQSLEGYAKTTDIPDVSDFISEIPSEYVTETELNSKGYITNTDVGDVLKYTEQELTEEQQMQARSNIGAGTSSFSGSYDDLTDKPITSKIIVILDSDDADLIQEQFGQIYEANLADIPVVLYRMEEDSQEGYRMYHLMKGYNETSEWTFSSIDADNQIHIVKYTNDGANRNIYTQTYVSYDYFDSVEFTEKVIAALPVAEATEFPIEEATA